MSKILILSSLALLWLTATAHSEPLRLAVVEWGGLTYRDEAGKPTGPWYDIMVKITEELGPEAELAVLPLPRIFRRLDHGETDLTLFTTNPGQKALYVDPEKKEGYHRVALVHEKTGIMVLGRVGSDFSGYQDLNGLKAAIGIGGCCFAGFSDNPEIEKMEVPDNVILRMVSARRVDAGILLDLDYNFYVTHGGYNRADYADPVMATPLEAWIHRREGFTNEAVLNRVAEIVDRMRQEGRFEKVLKAYRPQS